MNFDHPTELTLAIGFIQNVQLACFAIVFVLMAWLDRRNMSFRWLAFAYVSGLLGALFQSGSDHLAPWLWIPAVMLAPPVGYACIHAGIVEFLGRGRRTRWVLLALVLGTVPLYIVWSLPAYNAHFEQMGRMATLSDLTLAIETAVSASLLYATRESVTLWPRGVMATFLAVYSAVEFARVAVFVITGNMPDHVAPWVEVASGIVYVVSCSVLPMNFIWMMNARLHTFMAHEITTDPLTRILNRRGLENAGRLAIARHQRDGEDFSLVLMDIDHFKRLNDTFGHDAGDQVLVAAAELVRNFLRTSDIVGRLGGEEFVFLLPGTEAAGAARAIENLSRRLNEHPFSAGGRTASITASFGITAGAGRSGLVWESLLKEADQALYMAKRDGRNCARLYAAGPESSHNQPQIAS